MASAYRGGISVRFDPSTPCDRQAPGTNVSKVMSDLAFEAHLQQLLTLKQASGPKVFTPQWRHRPSPAQQAVRERLRRIPITQTVIDPALVRTRVVSPATRH